MVDIIKTEEKGSDVNLAVHLLNDGWLDAYDCAVVVSNDSDLARPCGWSRPIKRRKLALSLPAGATRHAN